MANIGEMEKMEEMADKVVIESRIDCSDGICLS
jgi:hypothetical protein